MTFNRRVPQNGILNRGSWADLEDQVRDWVRESEEAYIFVGPIPGGNLKTIGRGRVLVPECLYKVVARKIEARWHAIGFVVENDSESDNAEEWITRIRDIELMTGFDFLSALPEEEQEALETRLPRNLKDW